MRVSITHARVEAQQEQRRLAQANADRSYVAKGGTPPQPEPEPAPAPKRKPLANVKAAPKTPPRSAQPGGTGSPVPPVVHAVSRGGASKPTEAASSRQRRVFEAAPDGHWTDALSAEDLDDVLDAITGSKGKKR